MACFKTQRNATIRAKHNSNVVVPTKVVFTSLSGKLFCYVEGLQEGSDETGDLEMPEKWHENKCVMTLKLFAVRKYKSKMNSSRRLPKYSPILMPIVPVKNSRFVV